MFTIRESDWKKFKKIKEKALDKYCSKVLAQLTEIATDEQGTAHERYLKIYEQIHKDDKEMARLFDDHRRSIAGLQLMALRAAGLVDPELLATLSEELQLQTEPRR